MTAREQQVMTYAERDGCRDNEGEWAAPCQQCGAQLHVPHLTPWYSGRSRGMHRITIVCRECFAANLESALEAENLEAELEKTDDD